MNSPRNLLTFDSIAGLSVGALTLALSSWLSSFYGWPLAFLIFMASANLIYGTYSGTLTIIYKKTENLNQTAAWILVVANGLWGIHCFVQVYLMWQVATPIGLAVLAFEGLFVGGLSLIEKKYLIPTVG